MDQISKKIVSLRRDYSGKSLHEGDLKKDPFVQFEKWISEAIEAEIPEPNAVTLATSDSKGRPSARIVLLRGFDKEGFLFYSNYKSKKATDLYSNKYACLNFFWQELSRQVRISGKVKKLPANLSDEYFSSRPRGSQLGAWASQQSHILKNREELERKVREFETKFQGKEIPRPANWGGFCLYPDNIEFWQGKPNRLHDRLQYRRSKTKWVIERLAP